MNGRKGFTLAETLITLCIIGIVAAIIAPAANTLKPDSNKTMYLKLYDTLVELVANLASNSKLYPLCTANSANYPLTYSGTGLDTRYQSSNYTGYKKLCNFLAESFGVAAANSSCPSSTKSLPSDSAGPSDSALSFTATNGMNFYFYPQSKYFGLYVDINGDDDPNCMYSSSCSRPDRFKFFIYPDGGVEAADPVGLYYLDSRKSLTNKTYDLSGYNYASADTSRQATISATCSY